MSRTRVNCPSHDLFRVTYGAKAPNRLFSLPSIRCASTAVPSKSYSATLLLPKTKFKLWPNLKERDTKLGPRSNESLYAWQLKNNKGPMFILHDGPPYANGPLHMGHALNKILKDIINRFQVLQGKRVHYAPGWDCHGLPIEIKTLEQLKAAPNTLPPADVRKRAEKFARKQIQAQMAEFKQFSIMTEWTDSNTYRTIDRDYEAGQATVLKAMVERDLIYRRHRPVFWSPSSVSALAEAEVQYVDDHLSRSAYITFRVTGTPSNNRWSELIDKANAEGKKIHFLVWTTTPWTIPANMGIAVNTSMEYSLCRLHIAEGSSTFVVVANELLESLRNLIGNIDVLESFSGSDLVGTTYESIFNSPKSSPPLKVHPSKHVTSGSGTGVVHMAPAHGAEDYAVFQAEGLSASPSTSIVCPVDGSGKYSSLIQDLVKSSDHGVRLVGKPVLTEGTEEILRILRETGVLVKEQPYKHRYPYDSRTGKPMIIRATSQWFANVERLKEPALTALEQVQFHPPTGRTRLQSFLRERSEWCISRQRVWGFPIPSLHDPVTDEAFLTSGTLNHILPILEKKGTSYWWTGPVEEFLPPHLAESGRTFVKGTDTIDVWFDSGSSWKTLLKIDGKQIGENDSGLRAADLCLEGSDQHRGWFQSLLLTAVAATSPNSSSEIKGLIHPTEPSAPYRALVTHGFVLDESGRKMSKSLGNVISPITIISGGKDLKKEPQHGVDVLRLWAAGVDYTKDVSVGPAALAQVAESVRRLRNTARFMLGNLFDGTQPASAKDASIEEMSLIDRFVMSQLYLLERQTKASYEAYNIHAVAQGLTTFANSTLSSLYFDVTKDLLYTESMDSPGRRSIVTVLEKVLDVYTSIVAPIIPGLAEEIHETRRRPDEPVTSVFERGWTSVDVEWYDGVIESKMNTLVGFRDKVLQLLEQARREGKLRSSLEAAVELRLHLSSDRNESIVYEMESLLLAHQNDLKALCIVSDLKILSSADAPSLARDDWSFEGSHAGYILTVRPSPHHKCPRCWQFTSPQENALCDRCDVVIAKQSL